jgi:hypothetical protein
MRSSTSTYTSTCDRCRKTVKSDTGYPAMHSIYLYDMRGSAASTDPHRHFMDLCEDCFSGFNGLLQYLGAEERWKELVQESKRYESYAL